MFFIDSLAIACIAIGFLTIWDCHELAKIPHFYSLHAWLGLTTMGLFAIQVRQKQCKMQGRCNLLINDILITRIIILLSCYSSLWLDSSAF